VAYGDLIENPGSFAEDLYNKLRKSGLEGLSNPASSAVAHLVDTSLRRETWSRDDLPKHLNSSQLELWHIMETRAVGDKPDLYRVSPSASRALQDYAEIEECLKSMRHGDTQGGGRPRERPRDDSVDYLHQVRMLDGWVRQLLADADAAFSSARWRIGSAVVRGVELLSLKSSPGTVRDHVQELAAEYRSWRTNKSSELGLEHAVRSDGADVRSLRRQSSIGRLGVAMLRNPRITIGLLSGDRVRNFFITCFRQPAYVRREIVNEYLAIYGQKGEANRKRRRTVKPWSGSPVNFPRIETPEVSVVVPVFNHFDITMSCLASLRENSHGVAYEVILADDASTHDAMLKIGLHCHNAKIIRSEVNRGFLENCNMAVDKATGKYVLLLNNDAFVEKGCLSALLEVARRDELVGIVGPKIVYPDGRLQEAGGVVWNDGSAWNYGRGDDPSCSEYNYLRDVDYVSGAVLLVRRDFWNRVGGFDARFSPAYYEDTDLAFQARREGYRVVYQPKAVAVHMEGVSHGTNDQEGVKLFQSKNRLKFAAKWSDVLEARHYANGERLFLAREHSHALSTVLVVDHYVPEFDKDAGSRSTLQYLKLLVRNGARVKFLPDDFYRREPYASVLEELGIEVLYGERYAKGWRSWWRENGRYFDVVYMHRPHIANKYMDEFKHAPNVKLIFFGHDLHYLRLERQCKVQNNPSIGKEADSWRKLEFKIIEGSDVVYYPSIVEVKALRKHFPHKPIRAIPLYITEADRSPVPKFMDRSGILFVAGFRHLPNVDGAIWFTTEVLPRIIDEVSEARLIMAGSRMPDEILALASDDVLIKGPVSELELARLYSQVRVAVVPLRFGAGVKGKILEAMQHRVPVVTTPMGAEGLPVPLDYLGIGNSVEEFAGAVIDLYTNQAKWMALSAEGAKTIDRCFSSACALKVVAEDFGLGAHKGSAGRPGVQSIG
jgi:O-antigen biosynthesis protein